MLSLPRHSREAGSVLVKTDGGVCVYGAANVAQKGSQSHCLVPTRNPQETCPELQRTSAPRVSNCCVTTLNSEMATNSRGPTPQLMREKKKSTVELPMFSYWKFTKLVAWGSSN